MRACARETERTSDARRDETRAKDGFNCSIDEPRRNSRRGGAKEETKCRRRRRRLHSRLSPLSLSLFFSSKENFTRLFAASPLRYQSPRRISLKFNPRRLGSRSRESPESRHRSRFARTPRQLSRDSFHSQLANPEKNTLLVLILANVTAIKRRFAETLSSRAFQRISPERRAIFLPAEIISSKKNQSITRYIAIERHCFHLPLRFLGTVWKASR